VCRACPNALAADRGLPNWRLQLAGAATAFYLCAKEQPVKQTTRRCAPYRRARS